MASEPDPPDLAPRRTPATGRAALLSRLTGPWPGPLSLVVRWLQTMPLAYAFDKSNPPQGLSFPLRRSVLDAALLGAGASRVHCVYYWLRQRGHIVMRADFCGEGRRGWAAAGQASITIYAVPSIERQATEAAVVSEIVPRLVGWLTSLEESGNARRGVDQHFVASWEAGVTEIEMS